MDNTEKTIDQNKRSFIGPDGITTYYINAPNAEIIRSADWTYSKTYTKCLVEGITTAAEMQDILMRRGIIGADFDRRAIELADIVQDKVIQLQGAADDDTKRDLAFEVADARKELFNWNQRLNGPMSNTCEQMADESRLEFITSRIIYDANNKPIWNSYEDYLKEKSQNLAQRARFEVMLYLQGMESDFFEQTPEARAIKEIEANITLRAQEALESIKLATEEAIADSEIKTSTDTIDGSSIAKPKTNRKKDSSKEK